MLGLIATLAYVIFVLVTVALVWAIRELTEAARKDCEWEPWTTHLVRRRVMLTLLAGRKIVTAHRRRRRVSDFVPPAERR